MSDHRIEHPQRRAGDPKGWHFEPDELDHPPDPFVDDGLDVHDGWSAIRRRRRPMGPGAGFAGRRNRPRHPQHSHP